MSKDLSQGPIGPLLYKLTAPMVIGILAIFFFNLVDTYFIGLLGTEPLAAISFTFPITMLITNIAIGLSIATSAMVASAFGKKDKNEVRYWATSSLYLSIFVSFIISLVGLLCVEPIFLLLGADASMLPLIKDYMIWWLVGCPLLTVMIVINASIRASGNTKLPSFIMMGSAIINGILDPLLIFGLGPFPELGIQGAAIATVLSWVGAFSLILHKVIKDEMVTFTPPSNMTTAWKKLTSLGLPAALTNMLGPIANAVLIIWVASYGTAAVAAYGVGARLEPLALIVVLAFTASLPPFVGQNFGAGKHRRIGEGLMTSMRFLFFWQLAVYLILVLNAQLISRLFSDDLEVQKIISMFIYILPLSYFGLGFTMTATATINALHKTKISLGISLLRLIVLYLPAAGIGHLTAGLYGIFWGCAIANIIVGIIVLIGFIKVRRSGELQQRLLEV